MYSRRFFHRAIWVAAFGLLPSCAVAGINLGARGYLTWSAIDKTTDDLATPSDFNDLYVFIEREGGLEFKGAELEVTWNPAGNGTGCFDPLGLVLPGSPEGDCTYLNPRLEPVVLRNEYPGVYGFWIAWAWSTTRLGCSSGVILDIGIAFVGCPLASGCFTLNYLKVLDHANNMDVVDVRGQYATVRGGESLCVGNVRHFITASACSNGSITPSGLVAVPEGYDQQFVITPAARYRVSDVLVDGASVGPVSTYTFENVTADHTISACFDVITGVLQGSWPAPTRLSLPRISPNPFSGPVEIVVGSRVSGDVVLNVWNLAGQQVARFVTRVDAGYTRVAWDGRASGDGQLPAGVYVVTARLGDERAERRITKIR